MKTIKHIWKNLKWLFNHPPTNWTSRDVPPCTYCGEENNLMYYHGTVCICSTCRKKVYDKILLENQDESGRN